MSLKDEMTGMIDIFLDIFEKIAKKINWTYSNKRRFSGPVTLIIIIFHWK